GCTGKGNDQVRFEVGVQTLDPKLEILAPLRMWEFKTREEEIDYALANDIPITITKKSPYSIDENIWGVSAECGQLEDTNLAPPEDAYQWTVNPKHAPDFPTIVSIEFENGVPVKLNGEPTAPVDMVKKLNKLGGENGVGRIDMIENRVVGIKSREIYEAPAAKILLRAHHELEKMVLDRETYRHKQDVANKYGNLIYDGLWFSPLFEALTAFVDETQKRVTGEVQLEIYKGGLTALKRASKYSLYNEALATYGAGDDFNHQHSEGFIRLYGLPYKVVNSVESFNRGE
ncbi:MAG: argininosuccinate synthase, partial [Ignavibacteriales bacterium]|nr:argininosuccinate synthase [Ignavibacteriales bacterium]